MKLSQLEEDIKETATAIFRTLLRYSKENQGIFRVLLTSKHDEKPFLIVGNAHSGVEDGHCIAILNPTPELAEEVRGGVAYQSHIKKIVNKKCDLMLDMWIDDYTENGVSTKFKVTILNKYRSKNMQSAHFQVK